MGNDDVNMIKLLIYDLDGTLVDSRYDIVNSVNWTLNEMGLRPLPFERVLSFVGNGVLNLMRCSLGECLATVSEPILKSAVQLYRSRYAEHLLDETKLYPSVRPVLEQFKARKQAVLTNKPEVFSRRILEGLGVFGYFFDVIGEDRGFPKKPSPDSILELVRAAGALKNETVFIGDSQTDIETGKRAEVKTIAALYGFGDLEEIERHQPDLIVRDLKELLNWSALI